MLLTEVRTSVCPDSIFPARISDEGVRHPIGGSRDDARRAGSGPAAAGGTDCADGCCVSYY
jgi:hypothetical protein